jgi:hypothetical protein
LVLIEKEDAGVVAPLVKMLCDYLSCAAQLPALGADVVQV